MGHCLTNEELKPDQQKVKNKKKKQALEINRIRHDRERSSKTTDFRKSSRHPDDIIKICKFCSSSHQRGSPAHDKRCRTCNRKNHFASRCSQKMVHHVEEQDTQSSCRAENDELLARCTLALMVPWMDLKMEQHVYLAQNRKIQQKPINQRPSSRLMMTNRIARLVDMNSTHVTFKPNAMSCQKSLLRKISPRPRLKPATVQLSAYNGSPTPIAGKCVARIKHKGQTPLMLFVVVDSDSLPILGLNTCHTGLPDLK